MILDDIAQATRKRIAARMRERPLEQVKREAEATVKARRAADVTAFRFERALHGPGTAVIAEIKRASPSKGLIAQNFPYLDIAEDYQAAHASCISVLTEPHWFQGADDYLRQISRRVGTPTLRKDFTTGPYMVYEAAALGADAVLLISAMLSDDELRSSFAAAEECGLSAVFEAHTADEIHRCLEAGARVIGVNNRNLRTFDVDTTTARHLRSLVPDDVVFIAESGVRGPADVSAARDYGADAVLVGETLMRSQDRREALSALVTAGHRSDASRPGAASAAAQSDSASAASSPAANRPGRYGPYGGQYAPETLMGELHRLTDAYEQAKQDPGFQRELQDLLEQYANRPSLLYFAPHMTKDLGGAKVYLKREDLNHTGAHKINNVLGQALLARRMGKKRLIAETGAGQHGVATATVAALFGMECEVFMGRHDTERQALNVYRMELLGAHVTPVDSGTGTLKDAINEAMRDWASRVDDTAYVIGSVMGPHPYPMMVRDFQSVISREARAQILKRDGKLPDAVLACVGGGSNAMGMFWNFIKDPGVRLIGCEAAGRGVNTPDTAATLATGRPGVFHGMKSYFCQNKYGQIAPVYSISAGLDYPGVGPEHAWLHDTGRADYVAITDDEAVDAFEYLARIEGIICAIESAHAVAYARKLVPTMRPDQSVIICLSGRGDKDVAAIARYRGKDLHE